MARSIVTMAELYKFYMVQHYVGNNKDRMYRCSIVPRGVYLPFTACQILIAKHTTIMTKPTVIKAFARPLAPENSFFGKSFR